MSSSKALARFSPPAAKVNTLSTASALWVISSGAASADKDTAMRSSKWSRISPSSGLKVAISKGLHAYVTEMPSRSTMTLPSLITCNRILVASESSRLMSSTYSTPRWARANNPGWKTDLPCFTDSSTSILPRSMSSMTLSGIWTNGALMISRSRSASRSVTFLPSSMASSCFRNRESISWTFSGSALYFESFTTSMGGNNECNARAITDFAVPRPPEMRTPPMSRLTDASRSAVLMLSWPTTMDSGRPSCSLRAVTSLAAPSWASMAAMRSSGVIVAVCGRMPRAAGLLMGASQALTLATASTHAILRRAMVIAWLRAP
mmetsp:Transcript_9462/g.27759  ORF Transcript_9462/g.27759 Transcript_9462/m.27759 type:complete len:320 (+) Transcript_9462:318-1277(+)